MIKIKNTSSYIFTLMLLFLSMLLNGNAFADDKTPAGMVISSEGIIKAISIDKSERALARGDSFFTSETILVDEDSKIQLKFSDGCLVNLTPLSEFQIDSYSFKTPDEQDQSTTSLLKGGFRMLSGSIGQENPDNVTINTPIATIGIRGTLFECLIIDNQALFSCLEGNITIKNAKGIITIGAEGNKFASVEKNSAPKSLSKRPEALPSDIFTSPKGTKESQSALISPPTSKDSKPSPHPHIPSNKRP